MNRFANKVVIITGGNSGIGLATAQLFQNDVATVVVSGRNQATLAAAGDSIRPWRGYAAACLWASHSTSPARKRGDG
jgi:NAD(P)-dependent dehydrogenase (short-subunit alcohol dehydrogenase family)